MQASRGLRLTYSSWRRLFSAECRSPRPPTSWAEMRMRCERKRESCKCSSSRAGSEVRKQETPGQYCSSRCRQRPLEVRQPSDEGPSARRLPDVHWRQPASSGTRTLANAPGEKVFNSSLIDLKSAVCSIFQFRTAHGRAESWVRSYANHLICWQKPRPSRRRRHAMDSAIWPKMRFGSPCWILIPKSEIGPPLSNSDCNRVPAVNWNSHTNELLALPIQPNTQLANS